MRKLRIATFEEISLEVAMDLSQYRLLLKLEISHNLKIERQKRYGKTEEEEEVDEVIPLLNAWSEGEL
jgi:hypothetical protein